MRTHNEEELLKKITHPCLKECGVTMDARTRVLTMTYFIERTFLLSNYGGVGCEIA